MNVSYTTLLWLASLSWLLPLPFLVGSLRIQVFRWLIVCHLLSFLAEAVALILLLNKMTPNYAANAYNVIATIPIGLFFYHAIGWKKFRNAFIFFTITCFLFSIINVLFIQRLDPNYYTMTMEHIGIIAACIVYYYHLLSEMPVTNLYREPLFLIICGWFITYSGQIAITVTGPYLHDILKDNMLVTWFLFNVLTLAGNLTVTYGAFLQFRSVKKVTQNS